MNQYDICVIGGGISGLGIAWQAALAGYSCILLEQSKFCQATSANSLRIIHGGFRYLQSFDLARVVESLKEQSFLAQEFPDQLRALPCLMPLAKFGLKSKFCMYPAIELYSTLSRIFAPKSLQYNSLKSKLISSAESERILQGYAANSALKWYDYELIEPDRFAEEIKSRAQRLGAVMHENCSVTNVIEKQEGYIVEYVKERSISARNVINTTQSFRPSFLPPLNQLYCRAFNLRLKAKYDFKSALSFESRSKRLFFLVPRIDQNEIALGTKYLAFDIEQLNDSVPAAVSEQEVSEFLDEFNSCHQAVKFSLNDLIGTELGVLPRQKLTQEISEIAPERHYKILQRKNGYFEVIASKYTTFRSQALSVLSLLRKPKPRN